MFPRQTTRRLPGPGRCEAVPVRCLLLSVAVLALLAGGCSSGPRATSAPGASDGVDGRRVPSGPGSSRSTTAGPQVPPDDSARALVVIGDSLVEQADAGGGLLAVLEEEGYRAVGGGTAGLDVAGGYERWRRLPDRRPEVLVVALGTNEAGARLEPARSLLSGWLGEVPEACVVLVGVNEGTEAWDLDVHGPAINAMLSEVAAEHRESHVVSWAPDRSLLTDDGIHLEDEGRAAYRRAIVDGVRQCRTP